MRLVVLALLAAGCSISGGNVVGTGLDPAHNEHYQSGSVCVSYNSGPYDYSCSMSIPLYSDRWVPDRCYLTVQDTETGRGQATWGIPCEDRDRYVPGQWADRP